MIHWFYLIGAIVFEVIGTMALKYSSINDSPIYSIITGVGYFISFTLLYYAIKEIEIGTAYAIWAGVGIALVSIIGVVIFKEEISLLKILFLSLIIIGAVGLKYISEGQ